MKYVQYQECSVICYMTRAVNTLVAPRKSDCHINSQIKAEKCMSICSTYNLSKSEILTYTISICQPFFSSVLE